MSQDNENNNLEDITSFGMADNTSYSSDDQKDDSWSSTPLEAGTGPSYNQQEIPDYFFWAEQPTATNLNTQVEESQYSQSGYQPESQPIRDIPEQKKTNFFRKAGFFVAKAAIFGVIAGLSFLGINQVLTENKGTTVDTKTVVGSIKDEITINKDDSSVDSSTVIPTGDQNLDVPTVVQNVMPSIVSITSTVTQTNTDWFGRTYDENAEGSGSGIILQKNDTELLVVTNNHVVEGAKTISVKFIDDTVVQATIKGTDSTADLAVVSVKLSDIKKESLEKIKVATLGDSEGVKVGQMAIAIGNALGYGQSVTVGYISAKDREVALEKKTMVLLQTDAAINPGNSGGALLNNKGEVIGINSVKYASSEVEGMGYAIPISSAVPIINDLMNREVITEDEKGYLGIAGQDVTQEEADKFNIPLGVLVGEVSEDGAAKAAGILSNDIITKINSIAVTTISSLSERVNSYKVGTKVTLTVMRRSDNEYKEIEIDVTLKGQKTLDDLQQSEDSSAGQQQEDPQVTENPRVTQNPLFPFE